MFGRLLGVTLKMDLGPSWLAPLARQIDVPVERQKHSNGSEVDRCGVAGLAEPNTAARSTGSVRCERAGWGTTDRWPSLSRIPGSRREPNGLTALLLARRDRGAILRDRSPSPLPQAPSLSNRARTATRKAWGFRRQAALFRHARPPS